jgi:hypothetical protein
VAAFWSDRFAARGRSEGGTVETKYYSLLGRCALVGLFARPLCFVTPVFNDVTRCLEADQGYLLGYAVKM